jgi:hypothetical protein
MSEYADYPGGENFEPWQDHEWPEHCGAPATYLGEIGERELATLAAGSDVEAFLQQHEVFAVDPPITLDMVPPRAPAEGERGKARSTTSAARTAAGTCSSGTPARPRPSSDIPAHWPKARSTPVIREFTPRESR